MENYINNIVADVEKLMKKENEARPLHALYKAIDRVDVLGAVPSRPNAEDAEEFIRKAITNTTAIDVVYFCDKLESSLFYAAIKHGQWPALDAELYCTVCKIKQDEIIRKLKDLAKQEG